MQAAYTERTFNWPPPHKSKSFLRVIFMQINRLSLLSIHSCKAFFFGWRLWWWEKLLTVASLVSSDLIWVEHFHRVAPWSSAAVNLQHLQLWGFEATISIQSIIPSLSKKKKRKKIHVANRLLLCIRSNIVVWAVWYSVVTKPSRAANVAI